VTNSRWITKMHTAGIPGTFSVFCLQSYSSSVSTRNMLFIFYSEYTLLLFPKMWHVLYQHVNTAQFFSCKTHVNMAKATLICHTTTFYTQIFERWLLPTNKHVKKAVTTQFFFKYSYLFLSKVENYWNLITEANIIFLHCKTIFYIATQGNETNIPKI